MKEIQSAINRPIYIKLMSFFSLRSGQWFVLAGMVGIVSALGAIVFNEIIRICFEFFIFQGLGWGRIRISPFNVILVPGERWSIWLLPFVPALGGFLGGLLVYLFAPEAGGDGTDGYIRAFHRNRGKIHGMVPIIKTIASAITIGSGGSAGREGPISQIGAGFGSWLANGLKLDVKNRRLLLIAGTAGGVGAIFCAPLGGAIFAIEVLYRNEEFETDGLIPALVSSMVAYSVFTWLTGETQAFHTPVFLFHPRELIFYAGLGIVCAVVGILFVSVLHGMRKHFFQKLQIQSYYKPIIGGLLLGFLALFRPEIMSGGYGWIEKSLNENLGILFLLSLVFTKILATSLTISSGGSGGVFGPSLFIGSMMGGAFGHFVYHYFPDWISDPRAFTLVGMVAFFSGIAKVPIAGLLLVSEMAQSYQLLVPMMLVSSLTYILTERFNLYEEQVPIKSDSPAHFGEYRTDVLAGIQVREMDIQKNIVVIPYRMKLRSIIPIVLDASQDVFPVENAAGLITGVFTTEDIRTLFLEEQMQDLIVALDIADSNFIYTTPEEDLHGVLRKLTDRISEDIPVLEKAGKKLLGIIHRRDILNLYSKRLYELELSIQSHS